MSGSQKITLYSFVGSQWAGVAHLALAEKGFKNDEYDVKEVDLGTAENFDPLYLEINPNGTVPSLVSPDLASPLTESAEILRYLDRARGSSLVPKDDASKARMQNIIDLVHSEAVGTNLILFQARDIEELEAKKASDWNDFLAVRQSRLEKEKAALPDHPFYGPKADENGSIYRFYTTEFGPSHEGFFKLTHEMYRHFASGMDKLEGLLVLPFAVGEQVTEADLNAVPWLAHAMHGAGTNPSEVLNFGPLEAVIQKTVADFKVGPKTREWRTNIGQRDSFKKVFAELH